MRPTVASLWSECRRATVAVVGGGTAGVSAVAALAPHHRVLWFDSAGFASGELARYTDVPANTKLDKLLVTFSDPILEHYHSPESREALRAMEAGSIALDGFDKHDPSALGWTGLGECKRVFDALTASLARDPAVDLVPHRVSAVEMVANTWQLSFPEALPETCEPADSAPTGTAAADVLVLATGGVPRRLPIAAGACRELSVFAALDRALLAEALGPDLSAARVGVVGNSHTAAVVLMHLHALGVGRVKLFSRRAPRHAQFVADENDYVGTMSGLKGEGSWFMRRFVEEQGAWPALEVRDSSELFDAAGSGDTHPLADCDAVVQAVGFDGRPLPPLTVDGQQVAWRADALTLTRDPESARLRLPGDIGQSPPPYALFGLGIGFPEDVGLCVTSPTEPLVGFAYANSVAHRMAANLAEDQEVATTARGCGP